MTLLSNGLRKILTLKAGGYKQTYWSEKNEEKRDADNPLKY